MFDSYENHTTKFNAKECLGAYSGRTNTLFCGDSVSANYFVESISTKVGTDWRTKCVQHDNRDECKVHSMKVYADIHLLHCAKKCAHEHLLVTSCLISEKGPAYRLNFLQASHSTFRLCFHVTFE